MRYLCMHKASANDEAGILPPQELIAGMGKLIGETAASGRFLAGEGLRPSSTRYRLVFQGERCDVRQGPFRGDNDVPERMLIVKVRTVDEAIDWAQRFGRAAGAQRLELGPLTEVWDLGMAPKPAGDVPLRFMILQQASAAAEAGKPAPATTQQAVRALLAEMQANGVLVFTEALLPSSRGMRLNYRDGKVARRDGPFTESKELIGGFCMVQMHSLDEIAAWTAQFAKVIGGTCEIDVRVVAEPEAVR